MHMLFEMAVHVKHTVSSCNEHADSMYCSLEHILQGLHTVSLPAVQDENALCDEAHHEGCRYKLLIVAPLKS